LKAGEKPAAGPVEVPSLFQGQPKEARLAAFGDKVLGHRLTSVPVAQGGHDKEADGLVGALLQHGGCEALVCPLQSWRQTGRQAESPWSLPPRPQLWIGGRVPESLGPFQPG
jgi:hypothetical protein